MMFIYMPGVFNDDFIPYINQIITPILKVSLYQKSTLLDGQFF